VLVCRTNLWRRRLAVREPCGYGRDQSDAILTRLWPDHSNDGLKRAAKQRPEQMPPSVITNMTPAAWSTHGVCVVWRCPRWLGSAGGLCYSIDQP
jgi:hypothetical protein